MLHDNMRKARVTESDLWSKLREANVLNLNQVRAVVFEATGDISVLHGDACDDEASNNTASSNKNTDDENALSKDSEAEQEQSQITKLDPVILTGVQDVSTQQHQSWNPTVPDSDYKD